jgi:hypothetical protein
MKLNLDKDGNVETIHPNPGERCNLDDASRVRDVTLGGFFVFINATLTAKRVHHRDAPAWIEAHICKNEA